MLVYLAFSAFLMFYLSQLPLRAAFTLMLGEQNVLRFGVGLFSARLIFEKRIPISLQHAREYGQMPTLPTLRAGAAAALSFIRKAQFEGARFSLTIGTGDAAQSALLAGTVNALVRGFNASGATRLSASIQPDFESPRLALSMSGIVSVRAGYIIDAGFFFSRQLITGRITQWTSIRLKAS